ncbi:MAG: hypothetical protein A4E57_03278 [Syntrophorhabdaceae bacterium PtaU1.Bin034]|nr:MAG: hypothetical protein A4E57_03278 [Syntrophorhabdaceae bacterium PtaU1.Bin034]
MEKEREPGCGPCEQITGFVKTGMMFGEYYSITTATPRRYGHRGVEVRQAGVTGIFFDSSNAFSVFGIVTVSTPFL